MPAPKCGGCAKYLSPLGAATCSMCKELFHRSCVSLPPSGSLSPSWTCTVCTRKGSRGVTGNTTPVAVSKSKESMQSSSQVDLDMMNALQVFKEELRSELRQMIKEEFDLVKNDLLDELLKVRNDITELQSDRVNLRESIDALSSRCDSMEQRLQNPSETIEAVAQLRRELNERDQMLLLNDVEISNIPESNSESLSHTVQLIGVKLGVKLEDRDIVSVDRVGGGRINATSAAGTVETRPRPIVVRLARRDLRDELMRAARVRRGINTGDLDLSSKPRRFYLNERLTKYNRLLFWRVREAAQRIGWKYVWTKNGRILARHNADDKVVVVRSETDLQSVFGPDSENSTNK